MRRTIVIVLFSVFLLAFPAAAVNNIIPLAGDVFIGEEGLDISACVASNQTIAWFASGTNPNTGTPNYEFNVGDASSFYVAPQIFVGRTGNWFSSWGKGNSTVAFTAVDPSLVIKVWDNNANRDVTGKWVVSGDYLNFRIETNTYLVATRPGYDPSTDGFVTIWVKRPDGTTYTALFQDQTVSLPLGLQSVTSSLWYWVAVQPGSGWNTGVTDGTGNPLYRGTYTIWAELDLNDIRDNYKAPDGTAYTGKTVSALQTITIRDDMLEIEASRDAVVRGHPFSVTITGRPNEYYYLWVEGTDGMNDPAAQPPRIAMNQGSVFMDPACGTGDPRQATPNDEIGTYLFQGGAGKTIREDVPSVDNCDYYALLRTSSSGTRTVGFTTATTTRDQKFTVRVERNFAGKYMSDEVNVRIEKGVVTIIAGIKESYQLGDEIQLCGTNSGSDKIYLFITGAGLPADGGLLTDPDTPVCGTCDPPVFNMVTVWDDHVWEYMWNTADLDLNPGLYTVYAVAYPADKAHLSDDIGYAAVPVIFRGPQSVQASLYVASYPTGATILIDGVAQGRTNQIVSHVQEGVRNLTLVKDGYQPKTMSITVPAEGVKVLSPITLMKSGGPSAGSGTLYVASSPSNATILIDGTDYGRSNGFVRNVPAGTRNLTLTKTGYVPRTISVQITAGGLKVLPPITLDRV